MEGDRSLRFWIGFLIFTICNFLNSGLLCMRDGFLVDFFSTKRQVSGFLYGLVQASYGTGFGVALVASLTVKERKMDWSRKAMFQWTVMLIGLLSVLIGTGQFVESNKVLITQDFLLRFMLGLVSFKNNLTFVEMIEVWFQRRRDLFVGMTFTVRWIGVAALQYTGTLLYVKFGYFASFLIHGACIFIILIPSYCFIEQAESTRDTSYIAPGQDSIFKVSSEEVTLKHPKDGPEETEEEGQSERRRTSHGQYVKVDKAVEEVMTEDKTSLNLRAFPLVIPLLTAVAPWGLYTVMITPYFLDSYKIPVEKSSVYLTVMTTLFAVTSTAAGWLLQHISCFKLLLTSSVLLIVSPILAFLNFPKIVSIVGLVLYGIGGPLGILSVMPCMETIHRNATRSQVMTRAQSQIKSLWLGLWTVGSYCVTILAGIAMDHLTFRQTAFCISAVEIFGMIVVILVFVFDHFRNNV